MRIDVKRFYPTSNGILKQREAHYIVLDLMNEYGFTCVQQNENLKECVFKHNDIQYKIGRMEYWTFNKYGETGLDIDYIQMECITAAVR